MPPPYSPKGRLHHEIPSWVPSGEVFHVRIRCDRTQTIPLRNQKLADLVLKSVQDYHAKGRWHVRLFLLMPDHLHAVLSFHPDRTMSEVIRSWKSYHARCNGVKWQSGYFDHRIRNGNERDAKWGYIRRNPVVKELCQREEDWPWLIELPESAGEAS